MNDTLQLRLNRRWLLYAGVSLVHLVARAVGADLVGDFTQCLLMPALILVVLTANPSRLRTWTLGALGFSFLGDAVPRFLEEENRLPVLLGCFLLAHVAWIIALAPLARGVRASQLWWLVPNVVLATGTLLVVLPEAGILTIPVLIYGLALLTTSCLAARLGRWAWVGGLLFLISDSLIALESFAEVNFALQDVAVMSTYIVAHALLVVGVLRAEPRPTLAR